MPTAMRSVSGVAKSHSVPPKCPLVIEMPLKRPPSAEPCPITKAKLAMPKTRLQIFLLVAYA